MARKGSGMIREKPAKGRYLREYFQGGALAQLASQKLPTAQRMLAAVGMDALTAGKGLVKWEKGRDLERIGRTPLVRRNRRRILEQLADHLAGEIGLGVTHGDLSPQNILVYRSRSKRRPVRAKVVDYEFAKPLMGEWLDSFRMRQDYHYIKRQVIPAIAKDEKDKEALRGYFDRKLLDKIKRL